MKLPSAFSNFFTKPQDEKEYFFSLYIDSDAAAVAVWYLSGKGISKIASFAHGRVAEDSWEARIRVIDRLLSAAEEKVKPSKPIKKTVFGLPQTYLTPEGDIASAVRLELKKMSTSLDLTPLGFVPLIQALAFSLKKDEGVPPSIILIGVTGHMSRVSVYRVGNKTGDSAVALGDDPASVLEDVLKKTQDEDVLPSRMIIYGGTEAMLDAIRAKLLKHPWPARVNFLHYPKVSVMPLEGLLRAISIAGAAELSSDFGGEHVTASDPDDEENEMQKQENTATEELAQEVEEMQADEDQNSDEDDIEDVTEEEIANVEMVTPESLGFRNRDVSQEPVKQSPSQNVAPKHKFVFPVKIPSVSFGAVLRLFERVPRLSVPGRGKILIGIGGMLVLVLGVVFGYVVPRVTVTVLVSPQTIKESTTLTIDPQISIADPEEKIIPGRQISQSVSGEKTITVTGTKNIGDPAKGTVTIYNKVTAKKTFSKGTVLTGNGLTFTLDEDVSIASASESIGSITFGKADVSVIAEEIGPNGNLPAGTEFVIEGINSSQASARNESAFTGGTSKQVTVVSRTDQDKLVKELTTDLLKKAQEQLAGTTSGGERLIDETVETEVTERTFDSEIGEEASKLTGSVTVTVTGLTIRNDDVKALMTTLVGTTVPDGYALSPDDTNVEVSKISVNKDDTITLTAGFSSVALPLIDEVGLKKRLAGKDLDTAMNILREGKGVAGAEYRFLLSPIQNRLPFNSNNITITAKVQ